MFRGDRLKTLRESKNYTHQELADLLNVGYAQIYRFEAGKGEPSIDTLVLISQVFGVSLDYLTDMTDDPSPNVKVDNLTTQERKVLSAMRHGDVVEAMKALLAE